MPSKVINIFFAYASDSNELLSIAKKEIEIINRAIGGDIQFNIQEWKTNTISKMGNPEEKILEQMPIDQSNYFIGLFRFKYGKPTGHTNPDTGKLYQSGMEEEFFTAYRLWEKHKRPEILVFKSTEDIPREIAMENDNLRAMDKFFKDFSADGKHPGIYKEYRTKEKFGELFRQSILTCIFKEFENNSQNQCFSSNIFFDAESATRNEIKQREMQRTSSLKLQAKTGYTFLVPKAVHGALMRRGLEQGMKVQIIIQNPWSINAMLTLLRQDDFQSKKDYLSYLKNQLPVDELMDIYSSSHWMTARLAVCIKSYENLKRKYGKLIELRLSNRDLSNSILLTDRYLFFEPYFGILEKDNKDISVFEVQVDKNNSLYAEANSYFTKMWQFSYTFTFYKKNESIFEENLKNYLRKAGG